MTQETLKKMYQLLLTEPHAETVCFKLEAIAREALAQPPLPVQEQQQVGPVEDMLLRRAVLRSAKIVSDGRFVTKQAALEQPPLPVQEPVAWDKPSDNFNAWWDGDRRRDNANPFTTDSFAYWAFEGWQAALAQRPWQGLEAEDLAQIESDYFWQIGNHMAIAMAVEAKLKEKNR